jgi:hypothetical protein
LYVSAGDPDISFQILTGNPRIDPGMGLYVLFYYLINSLGNHIGSISSKLVVFFFVEGWLYVGHCGLIVHPLPILG